MSHNLILDRGFYRQKHDAQKVLAEFAATVRDEVDMNKLTTALLGVVEETMQPVKTSIWLKQVPTRRRTGIDRQGDS